MSLRQLDLNLLLVFQALFEEKSVTRAAKRLHLSQPATSNALARLREALHDPLFARVGNTFEPTPWARRAAPSVQRALDELERSLLGGHDFDPSRAQGILRLALSDYWHFTLLPELLQLLSKEAPGLSLYVTSVDELVVKSDLSAGRVDAAIFLSPLSQPGLHAEELLEDGYVAVLRKGHPIIGASMTLAEYAACRQLLIAPPGGWIGRISQALEENGLRAKVGLENAHVSAALEIVAHTDFLAVLPRGIAREAERRWPIRLVPLPVDAGTFSLALYWHEQTHLDPLHGWFRRQVLRLAKERYLLGRQSAGRPEGRRRPPGRIGSPPRV